MKLQQLKYFVAVYEQGSFSAGAQRVNATQSGLSMQVRELEDRYGVKLLNRSSAGVTPTDAGRRFYAQAVKVLRAASEAEEELLRLKGHMMGQLHVGLMPTFTRSVLPGALQRFTQEHPMVQISVDEAYSAQLSEATARGQLDFAIVPAYRDTPGLRATPMGTDREYLVTGPNSPLTHNAPVRLRDLPPLRLVVPGAANARRSKIDAYLSAQGVEIDELLELDAMLGTLELVSRSDWVAILPGILCTPDADGLQRKLHPIEGPELTVDYVRIEPSSRSLGDAAAAFEAVIQTELEAALNWSRP